MLLVMGADLGAIALGLLFAYWFRFFSRFVDVNKGFHERDYFRALPWVAVLWFISLRLENLYRRNSKILDMNVIRRIITGSILAVLIFFAFAFYERREPQYSRALVPIVFGSVVSILILERIVLDQEVHAAILRQRGDAEGHAADRREQDREVAAALPREQEQPCDIDHQGADHEDHRHGSAI